MYKIARLVRLTLTAPFVLLAIVFDAASSMMHKAADWLAPDDKMDGVRASPGYRRKEGMLTRLGETILWALFSVTALIVYALVTTSPDASKPFFWVFVGIIVLIGLGIRYVLSGERSGQRM